VTSSNSLRVKAAEIRRMASSAANDGMRWQLTGIAERFDRLADQLEAMQRPTMALELAAARQRA
jgi:hypothetical protein